MSPDTTPAPGSSPAESSPAVPRRARRSRRAWAVPALVVGAVAAGSLLPGASALGKGHPQLPARDAGQLLAAVQTSTVTSLSGTVVETARLGLPTLPGSGRSAALTVPALVTGSHTARIWLDGPERQRVALLGELAESEVVRDGRDVWTYASDTTKATHVVMPAGGRAAPTAPTATADDARALTPQAAATRALDAIGPTTLVGVERTAEVAGRPAYTLRIAPRDARSTVRQVLIAVDAATSVPLRVQVYGSATAPAFETGFTDVSFKRVAASVFRFTPPRGATVTTSRPSAPERRVAGAPQSRAERPAGARPVVHGAGWTAVLELPAGSATRTGADTQDLLRRFTTAGPDGSRVLHTALVNGLVTRDGRVFLGAVAPEVLARTATGSTR